MTALNRYQAAKSALSAAKSIDEVKSLRNKAEAMRIYAQQANDKGMEADAAEIRVRAERRLGELLAHLKSTEGLASGGEHGGRRKLDGSRKEPSNKRDTLQSLEITKKLSSRAQKLASLPEDEFENRIAIMRDKADIAGRTILKAIHDVAKKDQKRQHENLVTKGSSDRQYGTIVIDPPWPMKKIERDVRPNQVGFDYPTMGEDELAEFGVPDIASDDCHLFMWTTHKFLPMAIRLLEPWGFRYVLTMVWHKPGGFQPIGLPQYNCEFCLYARRGSPEFVTTKAFNTCFDAPRREHSRKPDEFYDLIKRVTPEGRIDVFSREPRDGFDQWGNQTDHFGEAV